MSQSIKEFQLNLSQPLDHCKFGTHGHLIEGYRISFEITLQASTGELSVAITEASPRLDN